MDAKVMLLGVTLLAACKEGHEERTDLGDVEIAPAELEFGTLLLGEQATRDLTISNTGTLPLGIAQIAIVDDEFASSFSLEYDFAETHCREGEPSGRGQVLDGGCSVPIRVTMSPESIGPVAAAIEVLTADDPSEDPGYFRDPDEVRAVSIVRGDAIEERPRIHVEPPGLDFGFVWIGDTAYRQLEITNVGSAPLTLAGVELPADVADQFRVSGPDPTGQAIEPGQSMFVEIEYGPLTIEDVRDQPDTWMRILSDDRDVPATEIRLIGDQANTAEDRRPQADLIGPPPGTIVDGEFLQLELDIHDANQPASSLSCRVMSVRLLKAALADCEAPNDAGRVMAIVPSKILEPGVDTIAVEVWDAFGQKSIVTTTILYGTAAPENDADGDGYADALAGGADCDDHDDTVYPSAAEIPDGKDNDCESNCTDATCGAVTMSSCIDEDTTLGDGDADCFVEDPLAANGGDCNDGDATTFPGAADYVDYRDNDCDGEVDEVISHDDLDGDGFSPWAGDCNDGDATFGPAAVEYCDGSDQNCDGVVDDACLPSGTSPVVIGGIRPERTDIGVGESVAVEALGFDRDGDPVAYAWTQDKVLGGMALVGTDGHADFHAPDELPDGEESVTYELMVLVSGDSGQGDWAFGFVTVHDAPVETTYATEPDSSGCGKNADESSVPMTPLLGLAWLLGRRRRARDPIETWR